MKYISKNEIKIDHKYLLSKSDIELKENIEGMLKKFFLNILSDNSGLIMRSADLKNRYISDLKKYKEIDVEKLINKSSDKNYVQIFKNLTGSNVKNTTNLLRDQRVNWYYGKGIDGEITHIEAKCINSKELPVNFDNIRSHGNNYFIFYNDDVVNNKQLQNELDKLLDLTNSSITDEEISKKIINISRNMKLQRIFRNRCLTRDNFTCAIDGCNVNDKHLLIASHIIPVSAIIKDKKMTKKQKIDLIVSESNGLTLCPNHDALVDKKYITFDFQNKIVFHSKITSENKKSLNINNNTRLKSNRNDDDLMKKNFDLVRKKLIK